MYIHMCEMLRAALTRLWNTSLIVVFVFGLVVLSAHAMTVFAKEGLSFPPVLRRRATLPRALLVSRYKGVRGVTDIPCSMDTHWSGGNSRALWRLFRAVARFEELSALTISVT